LLRKSGPFFDQAGEVRTGFLEAVDQPEGYGIGRGREDDRHGGGDMLGS
jgi:hypothetical protein